MQFKKWFMEALVKKDNLAIALQKTLEFNVDGKWEQIDSRRHPWYENDKVFEGYKLTAKLRNTKAWNPDYFFLHTHAILEKPISDYDSIKGTEGLRIIATMFYFDGKGGYQQLGQRSNIAGEGPLVAGKQIKPSSNLNGPSLKSPLELAKWVNYVVSNFRKNDDDDDDEPEVDSPLPTSGRSLAKV